MNLFEYPCPCPACTRPHPVLRDRPLEFEGVRGTLSQQPRSGDPAWQQEEGRHLGARQSIRGVWSGRFQGWCVQGLSWGKGAVWLRPK